MHDFVGDLESKFDQTFCYRSAAERIFSGVHPPRRK